MKKYSFLAVLALVGITVSPALGDEKVYRFKAETPVNTATDSTDSLNGEYNVTVSDGKCSVARVVDGTSYLVGGNSATELCRMAGIDTENRKYTNPPHFVGKTWTHSYSYSSQVSTRMRSREVTYRVVSKLQGPNDHSVFAIEGASRVNRADQRWEYDFDETTGVILKWSFDSNVGNTSAKMVMNVKLIYTKAR
jgi:hypothetical protein